MAAILALISAIGARTAMSSAVSLLISAVGALVANDWRQDRQYHRQRIALGADHERHQRFVYLTLMNISGISVTQR